MSGLVASDRVGTGIAGNERLRVLWLGGLIPATLRGGCANRDLDIRPLDVATIDADVMDVEAPAARALIVEYDPNRTEFAAWIEPIIRVAVCHGLGVVLLLPEGVDWESYESATKMIPFVQRLHGNYEAAAHVADRHRPGSGASAVLRLVGDVPEDHEARTLLRRALYDLAGVRLERLGDGRSAATVWLVRPDDEDATRRPQPWLIKLGDSGAIAAERGNINSYVEPQLSWRCRPRLCAERCVVGPSQAVLVQDFVDNAQALALVFTTHVPDVLIGALFGFALRPWTRAAMGVEKPIGSEFARLKTLRATPALRAAADAAAGPTADIDGLLTRVERWPAIPYLQATVHGDLHAFNVFVGEHGSAYVIDFANVTHGPVAADPACLEVSLVFGAPGPEAPDFARLPDRGSASGLAWMRSVYRYPLDPATVAPLAADQKRADVVRALRGEARKCEADPLPYAVAVACYLLRVASFPDNPLGDRAFAYELAITLIGDVDDEMRRRGLGDAAR